MGVAEGEVRQACGWALAWLGAVARQTMRGWVGAPAGPTLRGLARSRWGIGFTDNSGPNAAHLRLAALCRLPVGVEVVVKDGSG
jgi:hypothetical protein